MEKETLYTTVTTIISDYLRLEAGELSPQSHIMMDLGADSLALVELGFKFSESLGIGMLEPNEELMIIDNLISHIHTEITQN